VLTASGAVAKVASDWRISEEAAASTCNKDVAVDFTLDIRVFASDLRRQGARPSFF